MREQRLVHPTRPPPTRRPPPPPPPRRRWTCRLGYFPNVTHGAGAHRRRERRFPEEPRQERHARAPGVQRRARRGRPRIFSGRARRLVHRPGPAINAYQKSNGDAIRIVAGAASGGAFLVVKPSITKPADLKGKKIATPQLGNTQDIALRSYLKKQGFKTDTPAAATSRSCPQDNAAHPRPRSSRARSTAPGCPSRGRPAWSTRAAARSSSNEADLWPKGRYVTTDLIVAKKFLDEHPDVVKQLLQGELDVDQARQDQPRSRPRPTWRAASRRSPARPIAAEPRDRLVRHHRLHRRPDRHVAAEERRRAKALGFTTSADLKGIYDLTLLNKVLKADGKAAVTGF